MAGKTTYRIVIPTDTEEYKELIENIDKENDALGNNSHLHHETQEIKEGVTDMTEAVKLDAEAAKLTKKAEELTLQRNILKKRTLANEKGWRTTLEGKMIKNIQGMGDYGYVIDRSPKGGKKPPVA